jgi:hypothetical protein
MKADDNKVNPAVPVFPGGPGVRAVVVSYTYNRPRIIEMGLSYVVPLVLLPLLGLLRAAGVPLVVRVSYVGAVAGGGDGYCLRG